MSFEFVLWLLGSFGIISVMAITFTYAFFYPKGWLDKTSKQAISNEATD